MPEGLKPEGMESWSYQQDKEPSLEKIKQSIKESGEAIAELWENEKGKAFLNDVDKTPQERKSSDTQLQSFDLAERSTDPISEEDNKLWNLAKKALGLAIKEETFVNPNDKEIRVTITKIVPYYKFGSRYSSVVGKEYYAEEMWRHFKHFEEGSNDTEYKLTRSVSKNKPLMPADNWQKEN